MFSNYVDLNSFWQDDQYYESFCRELPNRESNTELDVNVRKRTNEQIGVTNSAESSKTHQVASQHPIFTSNAPVGFTGKAQINYDDGGTFIGFLKKGKRVEGIAIGADGVIYKGQFDGDMANGDGVAISANNSVHKGKFTNGRSNGPGIAIDIQGSVYKGRFKDGKKEGEMIGIASDDRFVKGQFKDGKKEGKAMIISSESQKKESK